MFSATTSPSYSPTWVSGQMPVTSPIAQRRSPGAQVVVDRDPLGVGLDAHRLEADPLDARAPAGCHEQPVAPHVRAAVELQDVLVTLPPRGGGVHPEHQLDAVAAQGLAERLAQRRSLAGKHAVATLDDHRFAAETPHDLRHLDPDRPATQDRAGGAEPLSCRSPRGWSTRPRARAAPEPVGRSGRRRTR